MARRLTKVFSAAVQGVEAIEVEIEVNEGVGDPKIVIVGLPDAAVKESRDRVSAALLNCGYSQQKGRLTINLAPADVKKEGPSFDLPIAVGVAAIQRSVPAPALLNASMVGELALDGSVRPVRGVLPLTLEARNRGKRAIFVPAANAAEASVVDGIQVYGIRHLNDAVDFLRGEIKLVPAVCDREALFERQSRYDVDFVDVKGQNHVKRALEIAAAGGHNLLMLCNL